MRLGEIAEIRQGYILGRIKADDGIYKEERKIYSFEGEASIEVPIIDGEVDKRIPIVKKNMVLFNTVSYNARKSTEKDIGKVISSNYVIVTISDKNVDPDYLAWYMGYSDFFLRELHKLKQGSHIRSIPISELRQIKLNLPDLNIQKKIGKLNNLEMRKKELLKEKEDIMGKLIIVIDQEVICGERS